MMEQTTDNEDQTIQIVLATNNAHKIDEIRAILMDLPITILTMADFVDCPDPDESGTTIETNARLKSMAFFEATGVWSLADDTGLEIDALDGAPGVYSARFAGPQCSFKDNCDKVLRLMADIPDDFRRARFRCIAALTLDGRTETFEGTVEGRIIRKPRGDGGFGYDPIFFVTELGKTLAEATSDEKNRVSHRGAAFRQVAERLVELRESMCG